VRDIRTDAPQKRGVRLVAWRSADQEALGLASGDVTGDTGATDSSGAEGNGAIDSDGLLLEFEQAPTASAAARISRASKDLTSGILLRGGSSQP
jgi:hypothetical protein